MESQQHIWICNPSNWLLSPPPPLASFLVFLSNNQGSQPFLGAPGQVIVKLLLGLFSFPCKIIEDALLDLLGSVFLRDSLGLSFLQLNVCCFLRHRCLALRRSAAPAPAPAGPAGALGCTGNLAGRAAGDGARPSGRK